MFTLVASQSLVPRNQLPDLGQTLCRVLKNVPRLSWDILKCPLEALWLVLLVDTESCHVSGLADEDHLDPAWYGPVSTLWLACLAMMN